MIQPLFRYNDIFKSLKGKKAIVNLSVKYMLIQTQYKISHFFGNSKVLKLQGLLSQTG